MLYDPKWEKPADVFSLESLIAWLEKQPANATYCYEDTGKCLLAQYFAAMGKTLLGLGNITVAFNKAGERDVFYLPTSFQNAATPTPHKFGAALSRARAALQAANSAVQLTEQVSQQTQVGIVPISFSHHRAQGI